MEELKELFGEESLDFATFEKKIGEKGMKLANIKAGGYVDKNKYEKAVNEFNKYKEENDLSKFADYDEIKAENERLKAEKVESEQLKEVASANVDTKFQKFVMAEVKGLVTDKKDFKACLAEYLKENTQFVVNQQRRDVFKRGSQTDMSQGGGEKKTTNQKMNEVLRGVRSK